MKKVLNEEFHRMQKLAGLINENLEQSSMLDADDLNELKNAIMSVYTDWLDTEDDQANESGDVWDTEKHRWVDLETFILSMLYRAIHPDFYEKLTQKIGGEDLVEYIEENHIDWIEDVENSIRQDIPGYFD